jgi:hypothetical protein
MMGRHMAWDDDGTSTTKAMDAGYLLTVHAANWLRESWTCTTRAVAFEGFEYFVKEPDMLSVTVMDRSNGEVIKHYEASSSRESH